MFFYGCWCYMKKHDITNDTPNFPSDHEEDEFLGGPIEENGSFLRGGPFAEDDFHGEWT